MYYFMTAMWNTAEGWLYCFIYAMTMKYLFYSISISTAKWHRPYLPPPYSTLTLFLLHYDYDYYYMCAGSAAFSLTFFRCHSDKTDTACDKKKRLWAECIPWYSISSWLLQRFHIIIKMTVSILYHFVLPHLSWVSSGQETQLCSCTWRLRVALIKCNVLLHTGLKLQEGQPVC